MKYYVTQRWPGLVDLWSSEDDITALHIKRLYTTTTGQHFNSNEIRTLSSLNPYLFDESEDMDALIGSTILRFL